MQGEYWQGRDLEQHGQDCSGVRKQGISRVPATSRAKITAVLHASTERIKITAVLHASTERT